MNNNTAKIIISVLCFFGIFLLSFSNANAQRSEISMFKILKAFVESGFVTDAIQTFLEFLKTIAGFVIYLGATLINIALQINFEIINLPIIKVGWVIVRDIANLFFVLAFIIMAFLTILKVSNYTAQSMFPKIISAAILVNFSLTMAGAILDATHVITKFFVDKSFGDASFAAARDIGASIVATLNPQGYLEVESAVINRTPGVSISGILLTLLSSFVIVMFMFFMGFLLLANALMLLTRIAYLSVLLIVSPIPWLYQVIPVTQIKQRGADWWDTFLKWAFTAPIMSFFLYLTLATASETKARILDRIIADLNLGTDNFSQIKGFWMQVTNTLILGGLLAASVIASTALGGKGAQTVLGYAKNKGEALKKWSKQKAGNIPKNIGRGIATIGAGKDKEGKTIFEKMAESKAAKIPLIGTALRGVASASINAKEKRKEDTAKRQKEKYSGMSKAMLKNKLSGLNARAGLATDDNVAAALELARKGGWNELGEGIKARIIAGIKRRGMVDKLAEVDPVAASETGAMSLEKATGKVQDPTQLNPETLKKVAPFLNGEQRRTLGEKGSYEQKKAVVEGIKESFVSANKDPKTKEVDQKDFEIQKTNVQKLFDKLDEKKMQLNSTLKKYQDAIDAKAPEEAIRAIQKERDAIKNDIEKIGEVLTKGGEWQEVETTSSVLGPDGKPATIVKESISLNTVSDMEEIEKRRSILNKRNSMASQTAWQGEGLFKEIKKYKEEYE